jgi:hypothetical protein
VNSGNCTTEYTRQELAMDDAILRESAMARNSVLRRALAIAAYERAVADGCAECGPVYMLTWVMQASDEVEREKANGTNSAKA